MNNSICAITGESCFGGKDAMEMCGAGVVTCNPALETIAAQMSKHRGWTHDLRFVFALIGIVAAAELISFGMPDKLEWIKEIILKFDLQIVCFVAGLLTHLFLDLKIFKGIGR